MEEEDIKTGERHHCCSAYLTFVSVWAKPSNEMEPRLLPRIQPTIQSHSEIYEAAERY